MGVKHLTSAAAIAVGIGLSALPLTPGVIHSAPADPPPPCVDCQPGPDGSPLENPAPPPQDSPGIEAPGKPEVIPPVGGGPKSGGRAVQLPP
jgi:hypothetical protein